MRTIKISFVLALLCIYSQCCFAQTYKYVCETRDLGIYECLLSESYGDDRILFSLSSKQNLNTVFSITSIAIMVKLYAEKTSSLKLYLSNGEILTGKYKSDGNSIWFRIATNNFVSNKVNITNDSKRMAYVMKQLRKYNIIKISIDEMIMSTPKFRSAATIDDMCKTLISKTGDQGQYGNTNSSSSNTPSKSQQSSKLVKSSNQGNSAVSSSIIKSYKKCPDNNHPHAIDLGLPSGTKWACCNVGATKPEEYGGYYAWGETEEKNIYTEITYQYCTGTDVNNEYGYYSKNLSFQNIGNNISGTKYDVAHVKWGGLWQMPTMGQIQELINNCSYELVTYNGVVMGKFSNKKTGGSILLPTSGHRYGSNPVFFSGKVGSYWSSTLKEERSAYYFDFDSKRAACDNHYSTREHGFTVRPVCK